MTENLKHRRPDLLKPTLIFSAVGLFIPGFTAIGILSFQMLLSYFGLECHNAWSVLWSITIIGGLILPILFYRHLKTFTENKRENLKTRLTFFNLIEYIFIQASLALFFTSGQTLCYVSDGQNGLELAFTAWIALPILIGLSALFNWTLKSQNEKK
ncbi:MAG: hypothetical protein HND54_00005 [Bacteroidetes bacterium]|nr:hypothetical protein [Bacteroidota bacterium]NOG56096.1 hypothetical protein [Bacteroidota bacterium]